MTDSYIKQLEKSNKKLQAALTGYNNFKVAFGLLASQYLNFLIKTSNSPKKVKKSMQDFEKMLEEFQKIIESNVDEDFDVIFRKACGNISNNLEHPIDNSDLINSLSCFFEKLEQKPYSGYPKNE